MPNKYYNNHPNITIFLNATVKDKLKQIAENENISRSVLIRKIINDYLNRHEITNNYNLLTVSQDLSDALIKLNSIIKKG